MRSLGRGSVGVDHNRVAVAFARERGFVAMTVDEWDASPVRRPDAFDGMLVAHVLEHMDETSARNLLEEYLPYLRPGGRVFLVCPQERGYASDATHVRMVDGPALESLARDVGLVPEPWFSFPFHGRRESCSSTMSSACWRQSRSRAGEHSAENDEALDQERDHCRYRQDDKAGHDRCQTQMHQIDR